MIFTGAYQGSTVQRALSKKRSAEVVLQAATAAGSDQSLVADDHILHIHVQIVNSPFGENL